MYRIYELRMVIAVPDYGCEHSHSISAIDCVTIEDEAFMLDFDEQEMKLTTKEEEK